jgi:hypothetical protein
MMVVLLDVRSNMTTTIAKAKTLRETLIPSSAPIPYKKILVPHDGSTMADNVLEHAVYLSNISDKEHPSQEAYDN